MTIWKFSVVSLLFLFNLSFLKLCEIIRIRIILADLGIWWWYCVCRWAPATSSPALGAAWTAWWSWRCLWLSWHPVRWPAWRPGTSTSCKCYILDANVAYTLVNFSFLSSVSQIKFYYVTYVVFLLIFFQSNSLLVTVYIDKLLSCIQKIILAKSVVFLSKVECSQRLSLMVTFNPCAVFA